VREPFRFERVVAPDYERTHAGYPPSAVEWLVEEAGLANDLVVDLAAGTGKLTRLLVGQVSDVIAIEPAENMLAMLVEVVPDALAIRAVAERIPLADGSVAAVTVAGSFHLFDMNGANREIARVLHPRGTLALFWKVYDMRDPVQTALNEIAEPYLEGGGQAIHAKSALWPHAIERSGSFGAFSKRSFANDQELDALDLGKVLETSTDVALLPPDRRAALLGEVDEFARGLPRRVTLPCATEVFVCSKGGTAGSTIGP
jgi:ubiquinone/menaquinone biosynthesis C-methylase UbiE